VLAASSVQLRHDCGAKTCTKYAMGK